MQVHPGVFTARTSTQGARTTGRRLHERLVSVVHLHIAVSAHFGHHRVVSARWSKRSGQMSKQAARASSGAARRRGAPATHSCLVRISISWCAAMPTPEPVAPMQTAGTSPSL